MPDEAPIWRAIEEQPGEDAFQVEIHSYNQFLVLHRVRRTWWRRLFWAPWRSHRLVEVHSGDESVRVWID